ncbi:MAG: putative 4-hydroxybenzoate polyprenyltransferase [Phycisphaerales bacterium]|nr:putative 4-hydroxybenzoate polyprenyltransferase [Phycisphaerales bacterium]
MNPSTNPSQDRPPGMINTSLVLARDIKLAHSVFALPFALLGLFMAAWPMEPLATIDGGELAIDLLLVIGAMITARTAAMLANRWFDREIDSRNPRTAGRALPAGSVSPAAAMIAMLGSSAAFIIICLLFFVINDNWWPLALSVPVLGWLCIYPLMKRMTWACHLWLGASLAMSPLAAALAVQPDVVLQQPALWLLAGMVLCWVSGFDIIYALQDVDIDQKEGLNSIPAAFGFNGALWFSRILHVLAGACLIVAWLIDQRLGGLFLAASIAACLLLLIEQLTVRRWGTTRMALTFFTLNGIVSCILGLAGIIDLY